MKSKLRENRHRRRHICSQFQKQAKHSVSHSAKKMLYQLTPSHHICARDIDEFLALTPYLRPTKKARGVENKRKFDRQNIHLDENDAQYTISADVPGISANDININFDSGEGVLILSGERKTRDDHTKTEYRFERKFKIRNLVDPDKVNATLEHGVLTVEVPKKQDSNKVVHITVTERKHDHSLPSATKESEESGEDSLTK
mmetsp:Transcript_15585/g.23014  ORF Transcript_15585/g.23014 Transcript_15585/m.23014 type:complete len:201 (-) Transcript_15585:1302-1904(-)